MTSVAAELRIRTHAKRLRLPLVASQAVRYAEEAAAARHDHLEFLAALLDAEVAQRDVNVERARIAQARFPELKELSDFNFSLVPSLNAALVSDLARCSFIDRREVVLAVGPPGTGKTHHRDRLGAGSLPPSGCPTAWCARRSRCGRRWRRSRSTSVTAVSPVTRGRTERAGT